MNLVVDIGNTASKIAVFDQGYMSYHRKGETSQLLKVLEDVFRSHPGIDRAIISSVGEDPKEITRLMKKHCPVVTLSHKVKLPFTNAYTTPETLGLDRLALATAACCKFPMKNVLVIDCGSCVTYDLVTAASVYMGGAISPGLSMRYRAMHDYTARLPKLEPEIPEDFTGDSTEASMHSGAYYGLVREIDCTIESYRTRHTDLTVILTGGDAEMLSKRLKNSIFAHSNFLLEGLNFLLDLNKD